MPIYSFDLTTSYFPPPDASDSDGLIAYGGPLHPNLILNAYVHGIFPWYDGDTPLWWCPNPRFVLFPENLKVAKSMRPYFNQKKFKVTYNTSFETVIRNCMNIPRKGQNGTWLNEEMIHAYTLLHEDGYVHSVEVWDHKNILIGGLYGLAIGKIFFGESMFTKVANASKFGFISLVKELTEQNFKLIDCQQETNHLKSLGAASIPRKKFLSMVNEGVKEKDQLHL